MSWRSLLYVPANVPAFLEKAQSRSADGLILDLEDSVPTDHKSEAREVLDRHWEALTQGPSDLLVRINGSLLDAALDLDACVRPGLTAIMVAKTRGPEMLGWIAEALDGLEEARGLPAGTIGLVPLLEDPIALEAAFAIARAPRVRAMVLGSEDYASACFMAPEPEAMLPARHRIVAAARAAGIAPLGLLDSVARLAHDDLPDLIRRSRAFGFAGATAVHPGTVAALNDGFLPSVAELRWAEDVLAAMQAAGAQGRGAARLDGRMIDRPMVLRAQQILRARKSCS